MYLRLSLAVVAAVLFVFAGVVASNGSGGLRASPVWFGLALAVAIVVVALPAEQRR